MRIEEAKRTGKEVTFHNEVTPSPINLQKREVHNFPRLNCKGD